MPRLLPRLLPLLLPLLVGCWGGLPRVLVHITDVHLSTHERSLPFGSIRSDFASLITNVLNPVTSDAVLVTGDLVDAKDRRGAGLQYEEEIEAWASMASMIDAAVLTVPGNHDRFDTGIWTDSAGRVSVRGLTSDGRVIEDAGGECPVAVLVGIDASPRYGLRSPANFLALTAERDVEMIAEGISAVNGFKSACSSDRGPVVVSFGHYPLSVFSEAHAVGVYGALSHAFFGGVGCLDHPVADLIARNANVYLCGHLHSLFGRLRRVHEAPSGHEGGRLHELEAAAFKDQRSFRILAIDSMAGSTCASVAEYQFLTPDAPNVAESNMALKQRRRDGWEPSFTDRGWGLIVHDASGFSLNGTMVVVTSPPDPSLPEMCGSNRSGLSLRRHDVRALVLMPSDEGHVAVTAVLTSTSGLELARLPLALDEASDGGNQRLFVGSPDDQLVRRLDAASLYVLHVEVHASTGRVIAVSSPRTMSSDGAQTPLDQNLVEFITLYVNWANVAHKLYLLAVVMLVSGLALFGSRFRRTALIAYVAYQLVGPLYACQLLSESWPFLAFQHGTLMVASTASGVDAPWHLGTLTRSLARYSRSHWVC